MTLRIRAHPRWGLAVQVADHWHVITADGRYTHRATGEDLDGDGWRELLVVDPEGDGEATA